MKKARLRENLLHFSNHWWISKETLTNGYWCFCDVPHQSDVKINEHNHFLYGVSKYCIYLSTQKLAFHTKTKKPLTFLNHWIYWARNLWNKCTDFYSMVFVISLNDFQRVYVSVINRIPHKSFIVFLSDYSRQSYCLTWFHKDQDQQSTLESRDFYLLYATKYKTKVIPDHKIISIFFSWMFFFHFGVDRIVKIDKNKICFENVSKNKEHSSYSWRCMNMVKPF